MSKLTSLPTNRVIKALLRAGWQMRAGAGAKHHVLNNPKIPGILTVPRHPKVQKGTLFKIIRQAGLSVDEFRRLYR